MGPSAGVPSPATVSWSKVMLPAQFQIDGRTGVHAEGGARGLTCDFSCGAKSVQCSSGMWDIAWREGGEHELLPRTQKCRSPYL